MNVQMVAQLVAMGAAELETVVPMVDTALGVNSTITNEITSALDGLKAAATALGGLPAGESAQPIVTQIQDSVKAVQAALATASLPAMAGALLQSGLTILSMAVGFASFL